MNRGVLATLFQKFASRWPILLYAATWTLLLTLTVVVASFSPELAFVSAISPSSEFPQGCKSDGAIRVPLDLPAERLCFPARMFKRSRIDLIVPPIFAAIVVAGSAWFVRAMGLWESEAAP